MLGLQPLVGIVQLTKVRFFGDILFLIVSSLADLFMYTAHVQTLFRQPKHHQLLAAEAWNVKQAWAKEFHAASIALQDREAQVAAAAQKMECQLQLLGATAVEDRLQDGVPKAVRTLLQAGIRVSTVPSQVLFYCAFAAADGCPENVAQAAHSMHNDTSQIGAPQKRTQS